MAFFLPLHIGLSNLFLILFFVGSGYFLFIRKQWVRRPPKILIYSLLPIFLLYCLGLFYSDPPFFGLLILGRNIAFVLCPLLLFFYSKPNLKKISEKLGLGITVGSLISISILLLNNYLNYFATRPLFTFDDEIFSYSYTYYSFTELLKIHPTYLGAYVIFAIAFLVRHFFTSSLNHRWISFVGVLILSLGVLFLNSRIIILLYILLIASTLIYYGIRYFKEKKYLSVIVLLSVIIFIGALVFQVLSGTFIASRFNKELDWELSEQVGTSYNNKLNADSRVARWKLAVEAFAQKPVLGYGTYMEKEVLAEYYLENNLLTSYNSKYDSHNIYLSFMIDYGIIGLLLLLFFLGTNIFLAIRTENLLYFFLFFMVCAIGCFESYLKNNAAITFVAFFASTFLFLNYPSTQGKE